MAQEDNSPLDNFPLPVKPHGFSERYRFPEDLTRLSNTEIGQWMSRLAAYRGYVLSIYARSEFKRKGDEVKLRIVRAQKQTEIRRNAEKGMTETAVKEAASSDPEIIGFEEAVSKAGRNADFYLTLRDILQGQIEVLSRELSRRSMVE